MVFSCQHGVTSRQYNLNTRHAVENFKFHIVSLNLYAISLSKELQTSVRYETSSGSAGVSIVILLETQSAVGDGEALRTERIVVNVTFH